MTTHATPPGTPPDPTGPDPTGDPNRAEPTDPTEPDGTSEPTTAAARADQTHHHTWADYRTNPTPQLEDALVRAYLPLIRIVMGRRHLPDTVDREDLASHLGETLTLAVRTWDPTQATFPTYATSRLSFGISQFLRDNDPISRHARRTVRTVQDFVHAWHRDHGEDPTTDQIVNGTDLTHDQVEKAFTHYTFSLPASLDTFDNPDALLNHATDNPDAPDSSSDQHADKQTLLAAMRPLRERQRRVLVLYYYEGLTLDQIAQIFSVTEGRISQIHKNAVGDMRKHLRTEHD